MKILALFTFTIIMYPSQIFAEHIQGDFDRLLLMREIAVRDNNIRAIKNIDYIVKTPNGKYFEVDNSNLPIESLVTKHDDTRQQKPLNESKDENILIFYFHRVDNFAETFNKITELVVSGKITPEDAANRFHNIDKSLIFSATYRAKGTLAFVTASDFSAPNYYEKAIGINKLDYKALLLSSVWAVSLGNNNDSIEFYKSAAVVEAKSARIFPDQFWEMEYLKEKRPEVYTKWEKLIKLKFNDFALAGEAGEVEVLHWWTSGGEAVAVQKLQKMLQTDGHTWKDLVVSGGAGSLAIAMTVLKSRVVSGNPPTAAQVKGPQIQKWAELGVLTNLDDVAKAEKWDTLIPSVVANIMKYENHWVAVPVDVHRINWMWCNPAVFKKAHAQYPKTWDEFFAACEKIKKVGLIPVAFGGQDWQKAMVWESIVASVGGPDFYKKALVQTDPKFLTSNTMVKAFDIFRKIKAYTDINASGQDWDLATGMVMKGQAAMQFMGDWAKGEFTAADKVLGKDYDVLTVPGTENSFLFSIDSFIMFEVKDPAAKKAQKAMASKILSPEFQVLFNVKKGSIPVRSGISEKPFDAVAVTSMKDFAAIAKSGGLIPSMAHEMAVSSSVRGAIMDVVINFYNSNMSSDEAVQNLTTAIKEAKI